MVQINAERLLKNLRELRTFGAQDPGVIRLSLSPVDMDSRRWLVFGDSVEQKDDIHASKMAFIDELWTARVAPIISSGTAGDH